MVRPIIVADLLCGAGGSTTGCIRALLELGYTMDEIIVACVNHWPVAIDTHQRNYPAARHHVLDIATVRPHLIVPEGYLDLLMASPTCTHHSVARGGKPTSDQQRSDPWHIITWLTELRVKRLIIENVWEFCGWGPVNPKTGKPIAERKGEYFHAWIDTIKRLGFDPEWRKLNAADYGDATTRQRFILMARSDGRRLNWPAVSHIKREALDKEFRQAVLDLSPALEPWRSARAIIDWSIKGKSIFNRPKPLAPKTLYRIFAGALKFGWPEPFLTLLLREIDNSLRYHLNWFFSVRNAPNARGAKGKRRTAARKYVRMLRHFRTAPIDAARGMRAGPVLITLRRNGAGSSVDQPIPTLTASGTHVGIAEPVIVNMKGRSTASSSALPLPTQTAHAPHLFTAEPIVLSQNSGGAARTTKEPLPTISTGGAGTAERPGCARPMLVEPFVLSQASGGSPRGVSQPIPTATTGGNGSSHALISPYYGSGSGETCVSAEQPLPTVTAKGRFGMVVPVTQSGGGAQARSVDQPIPTLTTAKGGEFAIVMPVNDAADGPVEAEISLDGYDILFRMLEPPELAAAMGFTADDQEYEFAGTKTEKIKQIGNAVSVRKMKACVGAIMADAAPQRRRKVEFREAAE